MSRSIRIVLLLLVAAAVAFALLRIMRPEAAPASSSIPAEPPFDFAALAPPAQPPSAPRAEPPPAPEPPHQGGELCERQDRPVRAKPGKYQNPGHEDLAGGATYLCHLHEDAPRARLVMTLPDDDIVATLRLHAPADADAVQEMAVELDSRPYFGEDFLQGEDLNGDGWMDLMVTSGGGSAGVVSLVYMYDPARRRFAQDSVLRFGVDLERVPGGRCVLSHGASGSNESHHARYCWRNGGWALVGRETRTYVPALGRTVLTRREPRAGGTERVTVDTLLPTDPAAASP